jgi:hypothetical protein
MRQPAEERSAAMHDVLVVVFDSRAKAEKGKTQLLRMGTVGTVSVYGYALVAKNEDGTAVVELDEPGSLGPFAKSIIGTLRDATRPDSCCISHAKTVA